MVVIRTSTKYRTMPLVQTVYACKGSSISGDRVGLGDHGSACQGVNVDMFYLGDDMY